MKTGSHHKTLTKHKQDRSTKHKRQKQRDYSAAIFGKEALSTISRLLHLVLPPCAHNSAA